MNNQRNNTLEIIKLFASYMVVFIHVLFYGRLGVIMDALARFAVPLFFLISGFYSYRIKPEKIKKRIKQLVILLIFSSILYTFFNVSMLVGDNSDAIVTYFRKYFNLETLINLFVFNIPVSAYHLWYLLAIIYVYIIFYFATIFRFNEKVVFFLSFSLLFLHILLGECLSALGIVLPTLIVRNFALMGIPFFALGLFAKKHEHKWESIPDYVLIIAVIIGVVETLLSRYFLGKNELYIGSLFILFAVSATFIKYSTAKYPPFINTLTGCSTYIYIIHILVSQIIKEIYVLLYINIDTSVFLAYLHPIIVCIVSTALAYFAMRITNAISLKKKM